MNEIVDSIKKTEAYKLFGRDREKYRLNIFFPDFSSLPEVKDDKFILEAGKSCKEETKDLALYIGIPFCARRCIYCSYLKNNNKTQDNINTYLDALRREFSLYKPVVTKFKINSLYIGGGTPNFLTENQILKLLIAIKEYFDIKDTSEITFEINPEFLTKEKLDILKKNGINRLSFGVQSFQENIIKTINRNYQIEDVIDWYNYCRQIGFKNINIDLIYGLPTQLISDWENNLDTIANLMPEAFTAYYMRLEKGTPVLKHFSKHKNNYLSEDELLLMQILTQDKAKKLGYIEHIADYFIKDESFKQIFNEQVWVKSENNYLIGVGLGSYSYFNGIQYISTSNIEHYTNRLLQDNEIPVIAAKKLTPEEKIKRHLSMAIKAYLDLEYLRKHFDSKLLDTTMEKINYLNDLGVLNVVGDRIALNDLGRLFADEIGKTFLI